MRFSAVIVSETESGYSTVKRRKQQQKLHPKRHTMDTQKRRLIVLIAICLIETATCVKFYWNIPTFMCNKHGFNFANLQEEYGIIQNDEDGFRGEKLSILYDPGNFPALLENRTRAGKFSSLVRRNGGVPQEGNLERHLAEFRRQLDELVPDRDNRGLIVIDFESWRPTFRQNFGSLQPYKDLSYDLEYESHPRRTKKQNQNEASRRFEVAGRKFMLETLRVGKKNRPNAQWGYYAFPYCFNGRGKNADSCPSNVKAENNEIQWLFRETDIIVPSVYMSEKMPYDSRVKMVKGRVNEAKRMARYARPGHGQIQTYIRYCYTDTKRFLEEEILYGAIETMVQEGTDGVILWGSSSDLNSRKKCETFDNYLKTTLGPVIQSFSESSKIVQVIP